MVLLLRIAHEAGVEAMHTAVKNETDGGGEGTRLVVAAEMTAR